MTPTVLAHLGTALLAACVVTLALAVPLLRGRARRRELQAREADLRTELEAARKSGAAARRKLEAAFEERREAAERAWQMLNALAVPVWRRDAALSLTSCNTAYAQAVEAADPQDAVARNVELRGGSKAAVEAARSLAERARDSGDTAFERTHVVAGGDRLYMELAERPLADGGLVGFARDITVEDELQAELDRHVQSHRDILGMLSNGVAIIGPDLRLDFFNQAYADAFCLDERFLRMRPRLDELLDHVRSQRALPEHSDFAAYLQQHMRKVRTLIEPDEELLHLPDGRTIRRVMYPHPFGGAFMFYEDVTDRLALESSYNTLLAVRQATLEHLQEAVAVIGADGRLKLSNPRFHELWQIPADLVGQEPHIRDLLVYVRPSLGIEDDQRWEEMAERIVAAATEPAMRSGRREHADGRVVDWMQVPLPDAASLFTYLDVTDTIHVERALRDRAEALETADRLKSEFIANISYELRTPLNAISGFAEMLDGEYFGQLNARQHDHAQGIVRSAQQLAGLINDILDLASIEAGYMELEPAEVSVASVMQSMHMLAVDGAPDCSRSAGAAGACAPPETLRPVS